MINSTTAASPNRATVSQPGASQPSATLEKGTEVPQAAPDAMSAATAPCLPVIPRLPPTTPERMLIIMLPGCCQDEVSFDLDHIYLIIFSNMAVKLDEVDIKLLDALQADG